MMDYQIWIDRERRIRTKLLTGLPVIWEKRLYRVYQMRGEICLCHEDSCPNCNSTIIVQIKIDDIEKEVLSGKRIRCRFRFQNLDGVEELEGKE